MPSTKSIRSKLDYLVQATGQAESEIVALAVERGVDELYRREIAEAYLSGVLDRPKAVAELGNEAVEDLDYARQAVDGDVEWGLRSA